MARLPGKKIGKRHFKHCELFLVADLRMIAPSSSYGATSYSYHCEYNGLRCYVVESSVEDAWKAFVKAVPDALGKGGTTTWCEVVVDAYTTQNASDVHIGVQLVEFKAIDGKYIRNGEVTALCVDEVAQPFGKVKWTDNKWSGSGCVEETPEVAAWLKHTHEAIEAFARQMGSALTDHLQRTMADGLDITLHLRSMKKKEGE